MHFDIEHREYSVDRVSTTSTKYHYVSIEMRMNHQLDDDDNNEQKQESERERDMIDWTCMSVDKKKERKEDLL